MITGIEVFVSRVPADEALFQVRVCSADTSKQWAVRRSLHDFARLLQTLIASGGPPALQQMKIVNGAAELENMLRDVLSLYQDKLWLTETLVHFLEEDVPKKSVLAELHIAKLSQQVDYLSRRSSELEANQQELQAVYLDLSEKMKTLSLSLSLSLPDVDLHALHAHTLAHTDTQAERERERLRHKPSLHSERTLSMISAITTDTQESSATTLVLPQSSLTQHTDTHALTLTERTPSFSAYSCDDMSHAQRSPLLSADLSLSMPISPRLESIPESEGDERERGRQQLMRSHNDMNGNASSPLSHSRSPTHSQSEEVLPPLPGSAPLPAELLAETLFPTLSHTHTETHRESPLEVAAENVLCAVAPTEHTLQHRSVVVHTLQRLLRLSLAASAVEVGVSVTRCVLPCDPLRLCVVIPKAAVPSWHTTVCESLTMYAERLSAAVATLSHAHSPSPHYAQSHTPSLPLPGDDDDNILTHSHALIDPFFVDCQPHMCVTPQGTQVRSVSHISHSRQNLVHTVHCVVDGVSVEIYANARHEMCLLVFYEEVAQRVACEMLFKRAWLLVRMWWCYETQSLVGCAIRHYLTDAQLCVMLMAVFNTHTTQRIRTPLQAFALFLAEYARFDGATQAITVQGIVPFANRASHIPVLKEPTSTQILSPEMLESHWRSWNIAHTTQSSSESDATPTNTNSAAPLSVSASSPALQKTRSASSDEDLANDANAPNAENSVLSPSISSEKDTQSLLEQTQREQLKTLSQKNLHFFERTPFSIVHPLTHMNMLTEKLSQRRIAKLYKAFSAGATAFAACLKLAKDEKEVESAIKSFFAASLSATQAHKQSQAQDREVEVSREELVQILTCPQSLDALESSVSYLNLMTESVLCDDALRTLAMEILACRGPLPVGEIGKILAESTSIPSLSLRLKERYGGLKKFLELFPQSFVVSNDHPFNPNVLLRSSLTAEQCELIDRGIFPHTLVKQKKAAANAANANAANAAEKKKKIKAHSLPSTHGPSHHTNNGSAAPSSAVTAAVTAAMDRERERAHNALSHSTHHSLAHTHAHAQMHSRSFSGLSSKSAHTTGSNNNVAHAGRLTHSHSLTLPVASSSLSTHTAGARSLSLNNTNSNMNASNNLNSVSPLSSFSLPGGVPLSMNNVHPNNSNNNNNNTHAHTLRGSGNTHTQTNNTHAHTRASFSPYSYPNAPHGFHSNPNNSFNAHTQVQNAYPHNPHAHTHGHTQRESAYYDDFLGNIRERESETFFSSFANMNANINVNNTNGFLDGFSHSQNTHSTHTAHNAHGNNNNGSSSKNGSFSTTSSSFLSSHAAPFEPHTHAPSLSHAHGAFPFAERSPARENIADPHQSFSTLGGLFPLKLSSEELAALNNSTNGNIGTPNSNNNSNNNMMNNAGESNNNGAGNHDDLSRGDYSSLFFLNQH